MINLIPKEEKKKMTADFRYRLLILFLAMVDFCIIVGIVALLPSYFVAEVKSSLADSKLEVLNNQSVPVFDQQTLALIQSLNSSLDVVEKAEKNKFLPSLQVINAVLLKKRSDIKITQISYIKNGEGKKISITGSAPSREVLLLFRRALEDDPHFTKVDLPISNFVKGSNIQFYLTLIPREPN